MAVRREDIHKMIDELSDEKLPKVQKFLLELECSDEIIISKKTERSIKESLEEYKKGEYYTFEEVFGEDE